MFFTKSCLVRVQLVNLPTVELQLTCPKLSDVDSTFCRSACSIRCDSRNKTLSISRNRFSVNEVALAHQMQRRA